MGFYQKSFEVLKVAIFGMPLSGQEVFPVVSALNQLQLSPPHRLQSEEMVTDKPPEDEVSRTVAACG